tara:strand:+ start:386 stop:544 length:159 start_codon:yes stop_codon:yes gene_type:complete
MLVVEVQVMVVAELVVEEEVVLEVLLVQEQLTLEAAVVVLMEIHLQEMVDLV